MICKFLSSIDVNEHLVTVRLADQLMAWPCLGYCLVHSFRLPSQDTLGINLHLAIIIINENIIKTRFEYNARIEP